MRRLAWFVAVVLTTLMIAVLLWQFRAVAVLFIFSLVLAAAVRGPITLLVNGGMPRWLATALVYLVSVAVIGGLLYAAVSRGLGELQQAGDALAIAYGRLKAQPPAEGLPGLLAQRLPPIDALYNAITSAQGTTLIANALGLTMSFFDVASKVVVVLVLSIYWGSDQIRFERLWLSLLPADLRGRARSIWRAIEGGVGAYLRSEVIQGILAGILMGLGYSLLGLPAPVLLALFGALAWFVPLLGGAAAFSVAAAAGAFHGVVPSLAAGVYTLAVFLTLELVVERHLFDRRRYSAILTLVVMLALADALGLFGLLVAPPLAAAIQILFRELVTLPAAGASAAQSVIPEIEGMTERLNRARLALASVDDPAPELLSLMQRAEVLATELNKVATAKSQSAERNPFRRLLVLDDGPRQGP
ncbi:MAG TPA: AI-2E family transporter [Anaerolineae bacterium]